MKEEEELEIGESSKEGRDSKILESSLTGMFEVFYSLYGQHSNNSRAQQSPNLKIYHMFLMTLQGMNLLSLSFPCILSSCDQFSWISSTISMTRFDYLMVSVGLGEYFYYFSLFLVFMTMATFLFLFAKVLRNEQITASKVRYLLVVPLGALKGPLYIPALCVMIAMLKNALVPSDFHYGNSLQLGGIGLLSAPFSLLAVVAVMIYNLFHYEQIITRKDTEILARPYGWIEVLRAFCIAAMVVSHFFLHEFHNILHLMLVGCLSCLLCGVYVFYIPFYNELVVLSHAFCFSVNCLGSIAQIAAIALDQGLALYLNIVCFVPVIMVVLKVLLKKRVEKIRKTVSFMDTFTSFYQYELVIRLLTLDFLAFKKEKDKQGKENAIMALKKCFYHMSKQFPHDKMACIHECIFTFTVLKKESLARIKLSKAFYCKSSLETSFLHHKYTKFLNDYSQEYIEEIDFIKYRTTQEKMTEKDIEACKTLIVFLTELSREKVEPKVLEHLCREVYMALEDANRRGEELVKLYPNNRLALLLVGTFVNDIYNNEERGNELMRKADYLKNHYMQILDRQKFTYFDEQIGIVFVSTHLEKLGKIVSIDNNAAAILAVNTNLALGNDMATFLPHPWNHPQKYNENLLHALEACEISDPEHQFVINFDQFLVETKIQAKIAAVESYPFVIYAFKRENTQRECLYFDYKFEIIACSAGFAVMAEHSEEEITLNNLKVDQIIKNFEKYLPELLADKIVLYKSPKKKNLCYLKLTELHKAGYLLYMTQNSDEMNLWNGEIATNFLPSESIRRQSVAHVVKDDLVGILKKGGSPRKQLKVDFCADVDVREAELTDFTAGKSGYRNTKEGKPIDTELKIGEMSKADIKEFIEKSEIVDLASVDAGALFKSEKEDGKSKGASAGASVMSFSASSGAGFTADVKARQLYDGVTKSVNKFNFFLCLAMFLIIGSSIAMHFFVSGLSHRYIQDVLMSSHAERRLMTFQLGMETRDLTLARSTARDTEAIEDRLSVSVAVFKELNSKLRTQASEYGNSEIEYVFHTKEYVAWEKSASDILSTSYNLQNLMDNIERHCDTLMAAQVEASAFYMYRNSVGETYNALNYSYSEVARVEDEMIFQYSNYCLIFMGCSLMLLVLCLIFVITPNLRAIERNNQKVWKIFFKIPLDIVLEIKGKCEDRLENFHSVDFAQDNGEKLFSKMDSRDKLKASRKFGMVIVPVALYYLITLVYLVLFYALVYSEVFSTLQVWHGIANWAALRVEAVNAAYFWTQEQKYLGTSMSYYEIVSEGQIFLEPAVEAKKAIEQLRYSERQLLGKYNQLKSDKHFGILFKRAEADLQFMHMGVHSALQIYIDDILYTVDTLTQNTDLTRLKAQTDALVDFTMELRRLYDEELEHIAAKTDTISLLSIFMFSVSMLVMYVVVFIPTLMRVKNKIKMIWKMGSIIPVNQRNKILLSIK